MLLQLHQKPLKVAPPTPAAVVQKEAPRPAVEVQTPHVARTASYLRGLYKRYNDDSPTKGSTARLGYKNHRVDTTYV